MGWLLLAVALLLLLRGTAAAMVEIWIRSETFAHAFLVPPIAAWLAWRRRDDLARIAPRPEPWVLVPMAAVCLLWLLGQLVGVNAATQFALMAILVLSVPALCGLQVARILAFPLLFLFFAVPLGEFMVPPMMEWTADFTVLALQFSGIPVYREGLAFVIPSGQWSVVEACSGIRYLIASVMVGTLFAYLNFSSTRRRVVFVIISILVPIVANWIRAYLIVMIGHLSDNRLAAGVDHIIYGWVFFGVVISLMFVIGSRFAEHPPAETATKPNGPMPVVQPAATRAWATGLASVALVMATQALFGAAAREHVNPVPPLALPASIGERWTKLDDPITNWVPAFENARVTTSTVYGSGADRVGIWIGYYRDQGYDHKLISSTNGPTDFSSHGDWVTVGGQAVAAQLGTEKIPMLGWSLRGSKSPGVAAAPRLRAWQVYWIGGRLMTDSTTGRLQLALNRLMRKGDDGAVVFVYCALGEDAQPTAVDLADQRLQRFVADGLPVVTRLLESARETP